MISAIDHRDRPVMSRASSILLWIAAALPMALLAALLFVAVPMRSAHADDDAACNGQNLLTQLQKNDPSKYAAIMAEGDKVENGKSIFWKIEKPGVKPSWLLGTMHVTDPRVLSLPKGAAEADKSADTIIVESDEILDEKKAALALLAKPELTMFTDGTTISKYLSADDNTKLEAGL